MIIPKRTLIKSAVPLSVSAFIICLGLLYSVSSAAQSFDIASPNGKLKATVHVKDAVRFEVLYNDNPIIRNGVAAINLAAGKVLGNGTVTASSTKSVHDMIYPSVPLKNKAIKDDYNETVLQFGRDYKVVFRAYNDAFAYRFITGFKDSLTVVKEISEMSFSEDHTAILQPLGDVTMNNYEHLHQKGTLDSIALPGKKTQLPFLLQLPAEKLSLIITEADLLDYPGLYYYSKEPNTISAYHPPVVKTDRKKEEPWWAYERTLVPVAFQPYIARTAGTRNFPWRLVAVAENDKDLLTNEIVYKLSSPSVIGDAGWIKPGKAAWDWWNDWNFDKADFKAGVNTATYKAYIDFAAKYKLEYVILDEGWYVQPDLTRPINAIDMPELIRYASERNVGIILWGSWTTFNEQIGILPALYEKWGIKGIKLDFIERDDQQVIHFYQRVAAACAEHHLLVDFHGASKPTGLHRTYPNVVNYEGVKGLEQDKWGKDASPDNALMIPFIRMFSGPVDYTPGAMLNAPQEQFYPNWKQPMSQGTRCQQLAMYILYDAPLQMLADNPSNYERETESVKFISSIPTTWDETIALDAKVGEFMAVARKKDDVWFAAAMTNWLERDVVMDFSFLPPGSYRAEVFQDGINANRKATDYKHLFLDVTAQSKLTFHLKKGGGCAMRISKKG